MNLAKNATRSKATECLLNFEAVKVQKDADIKRHFTKK